MAVSRLLLRVSKCTQTRFFSFLYRIPSAGIGFSSLSTAANSSHQSPSTPKTTALSARMSFIFEQIDQIEKQRDEKDQTLERIRAWRESKKQASIDSAQNPSGSDAVEELNSELVKSEALLANSDWKKEVQLELVHPWPEWIELMERLVQQNYFDHRRKDEDGMMEGIGFDLTGTNPSPDDKVSHFMRDFKTVQTAVINFGRDRFDILRSLSRQDLQLLVGYGCSSVDKKVVFSFKLLRKHVHLDEGDVCSSCSLRSCCEKAYLLTNKEDEARTIDVMRVLLAYSFDIIDGAVVNKSVLKMKSVRTVVRKLLHEVVKLSAVPIDPNLAPPVIKRPPPKVKQPPPPPKKRVGRNDVEMKKGDWLCPKCDFLNFAKNTVCLQCDAKRPKRQLLPGEWECPQCSFLNYRRNTVCFHCEHKRPPDTYTTPEKQQSPGMRRMDKISSRGGWNFDFDDNESDGADVAAFEYADSQKLDEDSIDENSKRHTEMRSTPTKFPDYSNNSSGSTLKPGVGFNDFDEDEDEDNVDSYDIVSPNEAPKTCRINFSELETDSDSDDMETIDRSRHARGKTSSQTSSFSVDFNSDDDLPSHPNWKSIHVAERKHQNRNRAVMSFDSDDDDRETLTSKNGRRMDRTKREKSSFEAKPFTDDTESDDEFSYYRDKQRKNSSRNCSGVIGQRKSSLHYNTFNGGHVKNARAGNFSKRGSFDRQRGTTFKSSDNQFDSYLNDERYRRPRINVR